MQVTINTNPARALALAILAVGTGTTVSFSPALPPNMAAILKEQTTQAPKVRVKVTTAAVKPRVANAPAASTGVGSKIRDLYRATFPGNQTVSDEKRDAFVKEVAKNNHLQPKQVLSALAWLKIYAQRAAK